MAYTLLVGAKPSIVRAAIMGELALFARQVGRQQDGLNTLTFTAALMAAHDPHVLSDISIQLSLQPYWDWCSMAPPARRSSPGWRDGRPSEP